MWTVGARHGIRFRASAASMLAGVLACPAVSAEAPPTGRPSDAPSSPRPAAAFPDSPRAALAAYLDLSRQGRYEEAARFLAVPEAERARSAELAERLKAVLDRHLWVDLDLVSGAPEGDLGDELPAGIDRIGSVGGPPGISEPVLMVRRRDADDVPWVFSRGTVSRIDAWYGALRDRWLRERLPATLIRPGPHDLLWWQWVALPLVMLASLAAGRVLGWITFTLVGRVASRTRTRWDDALLHGLRGPVAAALALAVAFLLLPSLGLYAPAERFVTALLRAAGLVVVFFALWRGVDTGVEVLRESRWAAIGSSARALVMVGARLSKVALVALALVSVLSELGYPVAGLVAGLGIGGLALALAAQKTGENLFGSLALALDRPFGVGDFVKVEDLVGTVEAIGLRSTQIRTLDRTLVTIPNGRLADMRLESFSARDRMRLACTVGLVYGTTGEQMRRVLDGLEAALRAHSLIWPEAVVVRFKEFGASSLDVEVMAWFQTADWSAFQLIRQEILLRFMAVVEAAGTSFAFPTSTVHLVQGTPPGPDAPELVAPRLDA
jgi:MscS family membrane protein